MPRAEDGLSDVERLTTSDMERAVLDGRITDGFTLAAWLRCVEQIEGRKSMTTAMRMRERRPALCGYDGREVYVDPLGMRMCMALPTWRLIEVRGVLSSSYSETITIGRHDMAGMPEIHCGSLCLSDCVVRSRLTIDTPDGQVVHDGRWLRLPTMLPETVLATLRHRAMRDVIDHPLFEGMRIDHVRIEDGVVHLLDDGLSDTLDRDL